MAKVDKLGICPEGEAAGMELSYGPENENMNIEINECWIDSIRLTPAE